ncbi:MAG: MarR family winged helix-turn-helix transcriptional regulator [Rhodobacteraceae bacterium]|nr:MarR family winged helix-turn-helix transcriptional regulator [Paracoccaceae bacterium]
MEEARRSRDGAALTDLILMMFRANNRTLAWGDRLVAPLGLTSARWQVMGTIVAAGRPQPVAWLARDLGANRQNVQRIVNDLNRDGLVGFAPNPNHRRAQLVMLTAAGQQTYDAAIRLYDPLVSALGEGLPVEDIETARRILAELYARLGSAGGRSEEG